jgi:hypothetical protein
MRCQVLRQFARRPFGAAFSAWQAPDRFEVRTVGRQEEKPRAHGANGPAHRMALVAAEIVHDDNVAGLERRHEEMLDIAFGAFAVDRSIKDARRVDPVAPQGRNVLPRQTGR